MSYTITFYALRPDVGETVVTVHRVERMGVSAYTNAPAMALGAVRSTKGEPRPDGFRIVDERGRVVLDYVDRPSRS